jgi:hypothetical protein
MPLGDGASAVLPPTSTSSNNHGVGSHSPLPPSDAAATPVSVWKTRTGAELEPLERALAGAFLGALDSSAGGGRWEELLGWLRRIAADGPLPEVEAAGGAVEHYVARVLAHVDSRGSAGSPLEAALAAAFPAAVRRARDNGPAAELARRIERRGRGIPEAVVSPAPAAPRDRADAARARAESEHRRLMAATLTRHKSEHRVRVGDSDGSSVGGGGGSGTDESDSRRSPTRATAPARTSVMRLDGMPPAPRVNSTMGDVVRYVCCLLAVPDRNDVVYLNPAGSRCVARLGVHACRM